jgi:ubiquitin carboxyl-terminal hydrolase 36/42
VLICSGLLLSNNKFCFLCAMSSIIKDHWTQKAYRPQMIHGSLGGKSILASIGTTADGIVIKKGFSKNRQEDTHEFFRFACDALQNSALAGMPKYVPPFLSQFLDSTDKVETYQKLQNILPGFTEYGVVE